MDSSHGSERPTLASGLRRRPRSRVRAKSRLFPTSLALVHVLFALGGAAAESADDAGRPRRAAVGTDQVSKRLELSVAADPLAKSASVPRARINEVYGNVPLHFETNQGQSSPQVKFLSRGAGYTVFLTPGEAVLVLTGLAPSAKETGTLQGPEPGTRTALRLSFLGANPEPRVTGHEELPGTVNYFVGKDRQQWQTRVAMYARVHYQELYPGIDLVYYGNQRQLEYDLVLAPGADPQRIALNIEGADHIDVDAAGDLLISTAGGLIRQRKPVIYQEIDGVRREIVGTYTRTGPHQVGFRVAAYDKTRPLVIDPVILYSAYVGSTDYLGTDIAVDALGNAYLTGTTNSPNFPITPGAVDTSYNGDGDAFVTKLDATGATLLYSTYLGGSAYDGGNAIAVDSLSNAYVTGFTMSGDFPTTPRALDTSYNGDGYSDAFVTKLDATGGLLYSTYLGSALFDEGVSIAVDQLGNAYVAGSTDSPDFPTTAGAVDPSFNGFYDAFVTKLDATGATLLYSTYLGGSSYEAISGIAVDPVGNAYVTGTTNSADFPTTSGAFDTSYNGSDDVFVTKLDATGASFLYSTYLGGSESETVLNIAGIAVDPVGNAYVTGSTNSADFPTTPGAFDTSYNGSGDVFVTKLDATGANLLYSTYLGGGGIDRGTDIAVDPLGNAYVTGSTDSPEFPTTPGALDPSYNGGYGDAFVAKLDASGTLLYCTYLGGGDVDRGTDIAVDHVGNAYVTGSTDSPDFPTTPGAVDPSFNGQKAFVVKIAGMGSLVGAPGTLILEPAATTTPVGTQHCVTATVRDGSGNPSASVTARSTVTGSVNTSGVGTTNGNGQATLCYTGPKVPGADAITAFADTDNDTTKDSNEPEGAATNTWVAPASTEGKVMGRGRIRKSDTARAIAFRVRAKGTDGGLEGACTVLDQAADIQVECVDVTALVVTGRHASIFGNATQNGEATSYRIDVEDLGERGGGQDSFRIETTSGYRAGGVLKSGKIQVRRLRRPEKFRLSSLLPERRA
jgi:Beta-propeller repeat